MGNAKPSMWDRPIVFLILTACGIVVLAAFEAWASSVDGRPFQPVLVAGMLIVTYALVALAALASAGVSAALREEYSFMANFNFGVTLVLAGLSVGLLDLKFDIL